MSQAYETVALDGSSSSGLSLERNVANGSNATNLVVAIVTDLDETVVRLPATTGLRRQLWLETAPLCPTNGVMLPRPSPNYPVAIWLVEENDATNSEVVVCSLNGRVAARGTISLTSGNSEQSGQGWSPWN